jgi:hypothetical protein
MRLTLKSFPLVRTCSVKQNVVLRLGICQYFDLGLSSFGKYSTTSVMMQPITFSASEMVPRTEMDPFLTDGNDSGSQLLITVLETSKDNTKPSRVLGSLPVWSPRRPSPFFKHQCSICCSPPPKNSLEPGAEAHTCSPSYSGGWDQENHGLRLPWAGSSWDPHVNQ